MEQNKELLIVGIAQFPVVKGDFKTNLEIHHEAVELAAEHGADIVLFPELSLTGYELALAEECQVYSDSWIVQELSSIATENSVAVIAGAPLGNGDSKPSIGAIISFPDGSTEFYRKQYLFTGEGEFCSEGDDNFVFTWNGYRIALAICADFANPKHSADAKAAEADLYLTGALLPENSFERDSGILKGIALEHGFPVLLSNHISQTGGWKGGGRSSVWNSSGELVTAGSSQEAGIVLCSINGDSISGKWITYIGKNPVPLGRENE